ncbi:MAG: DUF3365 domain-containing protein, partial [Deltaproteobacteria bacterium]|nr:DUF3365 domain-containing protein [Deltaproteobacteria bacterium]
MKNKSKDRHPALKKAFIFICLLWTISIILLGFWTIRNEGIQTTTTMLSQARSFFKLIVTTRYWNSLHGGVYVPVSDETQPNPYLDVPHRDVVSKEGRRLTLINPAYMTRQIAEVASDREQVQFHITSLKPIRPANLPEEWEGRALADFSEKADEYYDWWMSNMTEEKHFRYMAPLMTEITCLSCHEKQGYSEGDIRGGISVSIPAGTILKAQDSHIRVIFISYLSIWIFGIVGILLYFRLATKEYTRRSQLIDKLEKTVREVKTLKGLIPICASCKKVRNDEGYWDQIEKYISEHSKAKFSHGICPECAKKLYPN